MPYEVVEMGHLKTGDQIAICGNVADLHEALVPLTVHTDHRYFHHGIFEKETSAVYDFHGDTKENARPQKRDFTKFYAGRTQLYRVVYKDGECLPAAEVMRRAKNAVKLQSSWPHYHIIKNNCESFATYLKTGELYSEQALVAIREFLNKIGPIIAEVVLSSSAAIASAFKDPE